MDGQERTVLHSTNLVWPNSLTLDYATQTLYWIDGRLDYIESSLSDGSRREVLYREKHLHFRPFGLTFFKDRLYMADIDGREIRSFLVKSNKTELLTIYTEVLEPMSVVAVAESRQPHGTHIHTYSGTSDKEPSELGTTSLQRTLVATLC